MGWRAVFRMVPNQDHSKYCGFIWLYHATFSIMGFLFGRLVSVFQNCLNIQGGVSAGCRVRVIFKGRFWEYEKKLPIHSPVENFRSVIVKLSRTTVAIEFYGSIHHERCFCCERKTECQNLKIPKLWFKEKGRNGRVRRILSSIQIRGRNGRFFPERRPKTDLCSSIRNRDNTYS